MAVVYAIKNGNWSDPTTWNTGSLPQPGDTVCANNYTVTIDQDVDLWVSGTPAGIITTRAYGSAVAGGGFTCSRDNTTIRCEKIEAYTTALSISASGCVVYGDVYGSNHPSTQYLYGIHYSGSGTLQIYGAIYGGSGANHHYGVNNGSTGTVQITGNVTGGGGVYAYGVNNGSTGTVQITGNVTGGSGVYAHGVNNGSTGTVQITGNVTGGGGGDRPSGVNNGSTGTVQITGDCLPQASTTAPAVWNNGTGIIYINGTVYSGRNAACVHANNGFIRINGDLRHHESLGNSAAIGTSASGLIVLNGNIRHHYGTTGQFGLSLLATGTRLLMDGSANTFTEYAEHNGNWLPTGNPAIHYGAALHTGSMPSTSDVRYGVSYGPGDVYTGTCRVPPPQSVLYGVPVDNTTGTAAVTPEAIASAVWDAMRADHTTTGTFGAVSEWSGTGGGGGSDWTDDEKKQIRHRLGIDGQKQQPTSTPSLSTLTASDVWSHTTRTLSGAVDVNMSQTLPTTPTANTVGEALKFADTRLDATVSSRSTLNAQQVWEYTTRTLTGFTHEVTVGGYASGQSPSEQIVGLGYTASRAAKLDNLDVPISYLANVVIISSGTVSSDTNNSPIQFKTNLSGSATKYVGLFLKFAATAAPANEIREIVGFDAATGVVTLNKALTTTPNTGDAFYLIGYSGR